MASPQTLQVGPPSFVVRTLIAAPVARVMAAFCSHVDLARWWQAERSVVVARPSGVFAVTWPASIAASRVGGATLESGNDPRPLGGTLHGTVIDCTPDRALFVADAYWQPTAGEPLGPMALEIMCQPDADPGRTRVTVRQSASEDGPRWHRYFALSEQGWSAAMVTLKDYLESEWPNRVRPLDPTPP